jgi:hypothetical protein
LTITKPKPLRFSLSGFAFSDATDIGIFMILYHICLLPAQLRYVIVNIQHLETHVQLADRCALWKFISGAENLVLQTRQFRKVDIYSRFSGGVKLKSLLI